MDVIKKAGNKLNLLKRAEHAVDDAKRSIGASVYLSAIAVVLALVALIVAVAK